MRYVATCILMLLPWIATAQGVNGSIAGSVADASGSAVAGATVKLTSEGTGAIQTETTNAEGNFIFSVVLPGTYAVSAEHPGFKRFEKQHIELTPGDKLAVGTLPLEVGAVNESVTVTAEGQQLQTATSEKTGIVTSEEIKDLTVDQPRFHQLRGIAARRCDQHRPLLVQTFSGNNTFNVNGRAEPRRNNIMIDGLPSNNTNQGNDNTTISLDNTQTVEVKRSGFSNAESGRNNGFNNLGYQQGGNPPTARHGLLLHPQRGFQRQ